MFANDPGVFAANLFILSPDDKTAYAPARNRAIGPDVMDRIIAVDLNTGAPKVICTLPATGPVALRISPDGRTIAIARLDPKTDQIHIARVAIDGSDYRELHAAYAGSSNGRMAWTHDGRGILFVQGSANDSNHQLMRLPADGGKPEFTGLEANGWQNISVSPDGLRIAYSIRSGNSELWAMDNVLQALK